jgi:uncharacterized OB-fold protein
MTTSSSATGIVYTETVVFTPPEQYVADAPYQIAIIDLETGGRLTVRIAAAGANERVVIGDTVVYVETRDDVPYFRKASASSGQAEDEMPRPLI